MSNTNMNKTFSNNFMYDSNSLSVYNNKNNNNLLSTTGNSFYSYNNNFNNDNFIENN